MQSIDNHNDTFLQLLTAEMGGLTPELFFGVGFTQHIVLLNKCKDWNQRLFYIKKTVENHWTVEYAFQKISNPMGVAVYQLSKQLPEHLKNILPDPES